MPNGVNTTWISQHGTALLGMVGSLCIAVLIAGMSYGGMDARVGKLEVDQAAHGDLPIHSKAGERLAQVAEKVRQGRRADKRQDEAIDAIKRDLSDTKSAVQSVDSKLDLLLDRNGIARPDPEPQGQDPETTATNGYAHGHE